jgi:hypothetical protein
MSKMRVRPTFQDKSELYDVYKAQSPPLEIDSDVALSTYCILVGSDNTQND